MISQMTGSRNWVGGRAHLRERRRDAFERGRELRGDALRVGSLPRERGRRVEQLEPAADVIAVAAA